MNIKNMFSYDIKEVKMANRTANYAAFYVSEPFSESNLGV